MASWQSKAGSKLSKKIKSRGANWGKYGMYVYVILHKNENARQSFEVLDPIKILCIKIETKCLLLIQYLTCYFYLEVQS